MFSVSVRELEDADLFAVRAERCSAPRVEARAGPPVVRTTPQATACSLNYTCSICIRVQEMNVLFSEKTIGVRIGTGPVVIGVTLGSPAERAGVTLGMPIIHIGEHRVEGWSVAESVKAARDSVRPISIEFGKGPRCRISERWLVSNLEYL